jgi:hypothetical protein
MDTTRAALMLGTVAAVGGAGFLAAVPAEWMADRLALADDADAAGFLLRRFGASATAGLAVTAGSALRGVDAAPAALAGLAAWFGGQAVTAVGGLATGTVGGVAWFSAVLDPTMAGLLGLAAHRARAAQHAREATPAT